MESITLYHAPGACSRVTMNALEEITIPYDDKPINLFKGEQKSPGYLAVNPLGKVPALRIDGKVLTENAAILFHLHRRFPAAGLLPDTESVDEGLQDLVWCSSSVHPTVRQIRMPIRFTDGDPDGVRAHGLKHFPEIASRIAARVADDQWWYGHRWSIVDVYLYWNYSTAATAGFDLAAFPPLEHHARRVRSRQSFERALVREKAALLAAGISLPPGASL